MNSYIIWKRQSENNLLIEILNKCDFQKVKKEFLEKGYTIIRVDYASNRVFMKVVKQDE